MLCHIGRAATFLTQDERISVDKECAHITNDSLSRGQHHYGINKYHLSRY